MKTTPFRTRWTAHPRGPGRIHLVTSCHGRGTGNGTPGPAPVRPAHRTRTGRARPRSTRNQTARDQSRTPNPTNRLSQDGRRHGSLPPYPTPNNAAGTLESAPIVRPGARQRRTEGNATLHRTPRTRRGPRGCFSKPRGLLQCGRFGLGLTVWVRRRRTVARFGPGQKSTGDCAIGGPRATRRAGTRVGRRRSDG